MGFVTPNRMPSISEFGTNWEVIVFYGTYRVLQKGKGTKKKFINFPSIFKMAVTILFSFKNLLYLLNFYYCLAEVDLCKLISCKVWTIFILIYILGKVKLRQKLEIVGIDLTIILLKRPCMYHFVEFAADFFFHALFDWIH